VALSHNEILTLDVTAIIGLFFFITFQSFNPPVVGDIQEFWNKFYDVEIELEALVNSQPDCYESKYEFYDEGKCSDLRIKKYELLNAFEALVESGIYYGYMERDAFGPSSYVNFILRTPLYMYLISILMISPFVISVIVESNTCIRKKDESETKTGMRLMIIGFFAIIIGLAIIAALFFYANEQWFSGDTDRDGIYDEDELEIGTDQTNPDTDRDGLFDGMEEYYYYTDPKTKDNFEDRFKNIGGEKWQVEISYNCLPYFGESWKNPEDQGLEYFITVQNLDRNNHTAIIEVVGDKDDVNVISKKTIQVKLKPKEIKNVTETIQLTQFSGPNCIANLVSVN